MAILPVTARGQVTLRKDVLQHLGIKPGDKTELEKLAGGRVALRAQRKQGTIDDFIGILAGKTSKIVTLEEIENAIADGWAGIESRPPPATALKRRHQTQSCLSPNPSNLRLFTLP